MPTTPSTPIIATALAMRALIDESYPASFTKSISNIPVPGVGGIMQPRTWDLEDPNTEVGYLNANEVTSVIQHEGFRFWGNRTCSADPRFAFETGVLTAQWLLDTIINGCFPFIDQPLTPVLVSRPSRARGLKLSCTKTSINCHFASITGAWIETQEVGLVLQVVLFASITGAWIETYVMLIAPHTRGIRVHHGRVD